MSYTLLGATVFVFAEYRRAVLHYLLLKLLKAAPPSFNVTVLREKVPSLLTFAGAATSTLTYALR